MVPLYCTVLHCTVLPRYYRFSAALCMMGATVGVASQYFGDPIRWDIVTSRGGQISV